jgi:hypothetical protein
MLGGGDLKSLKQNLATYNKSSEISYDLGGHFRDSVQTRAGFPIGITEKTTTLYLRWLKCGYFFNPFGYKLFIKGFFVSPKGSEIKHQGLVLSNFRFLFPIGISPPVQRL